jgi:hypothetical protein
MPKLTVSELAWRKEPLETIASANFGGLTNRLRCLITTSAFSVREPVLFWDGNWSGKSLHEYAREGAHEIFKPKICGKSPEMTNLPFYDDWIVLTPEILRESKSTAAYCIDALNGDGLKSAAMLYHMPDNVFYDLQARTMKVLSNEFISKIERLVSVCKRVSYAVIVLRFWTECRPTHDVVNSDSRLNTRAEDHETFSDMLKSLTSKKWPRIPPAVHAVREVRKWIDDSGVKSVIMTSERWGTKNFYSGETREIRETHERLFESALEKQIANLFVAANAKILCRSKDSAFSHIPVLLNDKWALHVIDI